MRPWRADAREAHGRATARLYRLSTGMHLEALAWPAGAGHWRHVAPDHMPAAKNLFYNFGSSFSNK